MTTTQRTELDAAIERATAAGVEVMGHGHMKANPSERMFLVPSQRDPERHWHIVRLVHGRRLVCSCESRVICVHRAACHMELVVEAAKAEAHAAQVTAALESEAQKRCERDEANDRRDADRWELIEAGNW